MFFIDKCGTLTTIFFRFGGVFCENRIYHSKTGSQAVCLGLPYWFSDHLRSLFSDRAGWLLAFEAGGAYLSCIRRPLVAAAHLLHLLPSSAGRPDRLRFALIPDVALDLGTGRLLSLFW